MAPPQRTQSRSLMVRFRGPRVIYFMKCIVMGIRAIYLAVSRVRGVDRGSIVLAFVRDTSACIIKASI